ncbi:ParB/RepB/Spo0J family partition protein [Pseudomonas reactans]|uniref:ParB/RepB/Spo0J family partition protein n=1 Tax=Pseudomonas reactans TaxID=117680 RepID=UPI0015A107D5|nr:ParB/RepB/Spo0J family partition protein [Pseudomonas reactans]
MSTSTRVEIPYNELRRGASNVRRTGRESAAYKAGIEALAASILATHQQTGQGLLQNLVVHIVGDNKDVAAGGRRYDAIGLLIDRGDFVETYPVPCLIIGDEGITAASLTENVHRSAMHPADELDAFMALTEQSWTIDRIADSFGVTPLVVERRLKLRAASPALLEEYRADLLSTDQLIALCATDDHERQMSVWNRVKGQYYGNDAKSLRRAVIETEVDAVTDKRVKFIGGVEVYEKAGGLARRDLFAVQGEGVILEDVALLDSLVNAKLQEHAEALRTEGWSWVEVWNTFDWSNYHRFGSAPTIKVELPAAIQEQLAVVAVKQEEVAAAIEELTSGTDSLTDEEDAQLDALNERMDELEEETVNLSVQAEAYAPAVMEHAGALVAYDYGDIRLYRGLVRASDRANVDALLEDGQQITGGRETESAGRKPDALSDALRRSLLGHRNMAAQVATSKNADAAKVLFVCKFVAGIRRTTATVPTDMGVSNGYGTRTYCTITDNAGLAKEAEFIALGDALTENLPKDPVELWDAVAALNSADLDALIAHAMARSVSLSEKADGLSAKYLEAISLNMADHFTPTVENYLGRVSKDLILEALTEAGKVADEADRAALLAMKKTALANEAETRLAGLGWVPRLIRTETLESATSKSRKKAA